MAVSPLHTGMINGRPVRFYDMSVGGPELPWHAVDDLSRALGLGREARRDLLRLTQRSWAAELRTVATTDGLVTIAPHFVAQGLVGALLEAGMAPVASEREYAVAGCKALEIMAGDIPPDRAVAFALEAFSNTGGAA